MEMVFTAQISALPHVDPAPEPNRPVQATFRNHDSRFESCEFRTTLHAKLIVVDGNIQPDTPLRHKPAIRTALKHDGPGRCVAPATRIADQDAAGNHLRVIVHSLQCQVAGSDELRRARNGKNCNRKTVRSTSPDTQSELHAAAVIAQRTFPTSQEFLDIADDVGFHCVTVSSLAFFCSLRRFSAFPI